MDNTKLARDEVVNRILQGDGDDVSTRWLAQHAFFQGSLILQKLLQ